MKKIVIGLSSLIIVFLSGFHVYRSHETTRCDAHSSLHIYSKEGKQLELNLNITVVTIHKGSSELFVVGSLKEPGNVYVISRHLFMAVKSSGFKDYSKTTITREERHPIDNLPNDLWQQYVLPAAPSVAFYMEIKRLNKKIYFFRGLTSPILVCVKTSN
ncbi:hypothetical protein [Serratia bockelmannii]|uniref:hypothetical protein n=1 Tax=Serratia bockelmannii TaxID=2703793 RepID=UPI003F6AD853